MRKVSIIFVLLFCMGCARTVWYKHNATLEDSVQDSLECMYDANKSYGDSIFLYYQCMSVRGYRQMEQIIGKPITNIDQVWENVPKGTRIRQVDHMGLIYVTGK